MHNATQNSFQIFFTSGKHANHLIVKIIRRLIFFSHSVLESPWKRSQSTAARELYDGTQETDSQFQRTDTIG